MQCERRPELLHNNGFANIQGANFWVHHILDLQIHVWLKYCGECVDKQHKTGLVFIAFNAFVLLQKKTTINKGSRSISIEITINLQVEAIV